MREEHLLRLMVLTHAPDLSAADREAIREALAILREPAREGEEAKPILAATRRTIEGMVAALEAINEKGEGENPVIMSMLVFLVPIASAAMMMRELGPRFNQLAKKSPHLAIALADAMNAAQKQREGK